MSLITDVKNLTPLWVVICRNSSEQAYVLNWCKVNEKSVSNWMVGNNKFPMCYDIREGVAGWTDLLDRAMSYIDFITFYNNESYIQEQTK